MNAGNTVLQTLGRHLATVGPVGYMPIAPGTWGSLAAVIAAPWLFLPFSLTVQILILAALFLLGSWACSAAETHFGRKDPGQAVIDEVLGQWVTFLFLASSGIFLLAAGFFLFRLFDILKPWPVRSSEKWFPGGYSVMVDDLLAGIYALAALTILERLILANLFPSLL
ncbi:phosphatidylglycerophosphatase A [Desulfonatronospira sp. MSAO_Bac3]|uniref:phosphatidylglycerophosphatase A family protein n=1 Tax=Desulfonatronospira sp. MSAO_Bac3 TaxID=2293857 RepID=UPI000FEEFDE7|nr:phosphatidylglycerophosphatase A [Desulfonatronospira sp. MSAO_Bac3]RQD77132.1 MAG: phosphatidylglycerophosphatase A [Desulfonatronospira sp. MSAO_Bac3]